MYFTRYKNIFNLMNYLTSRRPIQCYYYQEDNKFIIIMNDTLERISYLEINQKTIENIIMKVPYFEWDVNQNIFSSEKRIKDVTPCLLLPNLINKTNKIMYCYMNKDWKVLLYNRFKYSGL